MKEPQPMQSATGYYTRRGFITKLAMDGAKVAIPLFLMNHLYGCASDPFKQDPEDFTISNFDRWYKRNRLYNGSNPNLVGIRTMHTFKQAFPNGWTPGIGYTVPWGEEMVAAAPGIVTNVKTLNTGRAGGRMVTVSHPVSYNNSTPAEMYTYYAHLNSVFVTTGQNIKRGDRIGDVTEHKDYAKLMFEIAKNWVDPDNYGRDHSYMEYMTDMDPSYLASDLEVQSKKDENQRAAFRSLDSRLDSADVKPRKWHKKSGHGACIWSIVDSFRYLSTLYEVKPDFFPELSQDQFQVIQRAFYDNQPIVLTLPLKKKA